VNRPLVDHSSSKKNSNLLVRTELIQSLSTGKARRRRAALRRRPLAGLKLIGFSVWERRSGSGRNVTFPARQYAVNGERRSFALLRPIVDTSAQDGVREAILAAYAEPEAAAAA
jgi:hypothetical protein